MIIFGTYLAQAAAHAHAAPCATACDTISPPTSNALVRGYFGWWQQASGPNQRKPSRRFRTPLTFSGRAILAYQS
jgi:hypothetical protein